MLGRVIEVIYQRDKLVGPCALVEGVESDHRSSCTFYVVCPSVHILIKIVRLSCPEHSLQINDSIVDPEKLPFCCSAL